jgi:hypothetical protein
MIFLHKEKVDSRIGAAFEPPWVRQLNCRTDGAAPAAMKHGKACEADCRI